MSGQASSKGYFHAIETVASNNGSNIFHRCGYSSRAYVPEMWLKVSHTLPQNRLEYLDNRMAAHEDRYIKTSGMLVAELRHNA